MNYQRMSSNGTTVEAINGKHYVNGVEVETGSLKIIYYFVVLAMFSIGLLIGYVLGILGAGN